VEIKDKSFKELAELLGKIAESLDEGGKEFVSIADDIIISSIRLKQLIQEKQDLAQGKIK